jgi:hypothetical protein
MRTSKNGICTAGKAKNNVQRCEGSENIPVITVLVWERKKQWRHGESKSKAAAVAQISFIRIIAVTSWDAQV